MAKINGVFTGITGKVGNTIFQMLNGEQIMKTFAIPANPESAGQVAQRGVFRDIISTFKSIASTVIGIFWNPFTSTNKTGWGNFISKNLISMGKTTFDITKAILSYGSLEPISGLEATYDTATGEMAIEYVGDKFVNGADDDCVQLIVYDDDSETIVGKFLDTTTRVAEIAEPTIASGLTATDLHVFLWLSQEESTEPDIGLVSNSSHCTCTAPA